MVEVKEVTYVAEKISVIKAGKIYFRKLEPTESLHRFVMPF